MSSYSCVKGLVVFSLTLVLGFASASLFIPDVEVTETPQPPITKKEILVKPKDKKVCVKEYEKLDKYVEEDEVIYAPLIYKKAKLKEELVKFGSKKIEKEIEKVNTEIERLKKLELQKKYGFTGFAENKKLLYTENCYDTTF